MKCSNYEFALDINCKYNELSKGPYSPVWINGISELTESELRGLHCGYVDAAIVLRVKAKKFIWLRFSNN